MSILSFIDILTSIEDFPKDLIILLVSQAGREKEESEPIEVTTGERSSLVEHFRGGKCLLWVEREGLERN